MNKYILRTSLVWLAILAAVLGVLSYRSGSLRNRFGRHSTSASGTLQPEAAGPPAAAAGQPSPDQPIQEASPAPNPAPVQLTPERMQSIGVQIGEVAYKQVGDDLRATGTVDIDERLMSYVQVRFPGYIRRVFANATYQYVHAGEPLFTVYSPELVATQQELLLARQNQRVLGRSPVDGVASGAEALAGAAEQRLKQWSVPQSEIDKLTASGKPIVDLAIDSPATGYITERNALPNMYVEPSTKLYTIADLSRIWVYAQVFQDDVGRLKPGDSAQITVDAYPGRTFFARIGAILPQVDMTTRTVRVRLALANPGLLLKPGMFVNVSLNTGTARSLVIPSSAVLQSGTRQLVFLEEGNGSFRPKEVTLGGRAGDNLIVLKGLPEHQLIVTSANFLIDSESQLQAAASSFQSQPPSGGVTASQNGRPPGSQGLQATMELSTDPNPPQRGNNLLQVKIADPAGTPVMGADVTVRFYMPAMAAMGMAAMEITSKLTDKGNGIYQGTGKLDSGGTWQVTITAQKAGRTLAVKQLRVNAAGGM